MTLETESGNTLRAMVLASLFAALIVVGALIAVPIGPVPIYLANFFVLLSGLVLGPRWGVAAVGVYLLAGIMGLPVFSAGTGGVGRFWGPTGGYLLSYLPAVYLAGILSNRGKPSVQLDVIAMVVATLVIYSIGVPWLKWVTQMSWGKALMAGMVPFLLGDAFKIAAAVPVARIVRPMIHPVGWEKPAARAH